MTSAKDEINKLINQAKSLREQAIINLNSGIASSNSPIIGDYVVKSLIPHGYKRAARKLGRNYRMEEKMKLTNQWRQQGTRCLEECLSTTKKMSIYSKSLTSKGNSDRLIRKFNKVRKTVDPIVFFNNFITILEEIKTYDLIWNSEISQMHTRHKEIKIEEKQRLENEQRKSLLKMLKKYPQTKESVLGALECIEADRPDSYRHCVISCRASIESLCIEMSGLKDFNKALKQVLPSNTDQKQVKQAFQYLSGRGAHGGFSPTKDYAEYGLQITIATLTFIINTQKLEELI
ncbi:MAG: hypothetical protein KAS32_29965 [Candidatus Peribacteraceae bacterium]|nr:hypothetical protein [Candidatus Peribacteraceae bacterium]